MSALLRDRTALLQCVPQDISNFSTNYAALSTEPRAEFWTYLISCIVEFESGFNPNSTYTENFNYAQGKPVVSIGLLQLSFESEHSICGLNSPDDLFSPQTNLTCGIRVMQSLVCRDKVISRTNGQRYFGAARYWSTLRPNEHRHPLENIQHWCLQLVLGEAGV
jgi:hypothetical protein